MEKTIFEKIIAKEIPSEIIFENSDTIVINDNQPQAPVHCIVITRKRFCNIVEMEPSIFGSVQQAIIETVRIKGISRSGYRIVTNVGENGRQSVAHLHFHVLGGVQLSSRIG